MKKCCTCKRVLPSDQFYKAKRYRTGLQPQCKACNLLSVKKYQKKRSKSRVHRSVRYGLTFREVDLLLCVPACQSCGKPFASDADVRFDHCHDGGHIRGVICHSCNITCSGSAIEAVMRLGMCRRYLLRDLEWQLEQARAG